MSTISTYNAVAESWDKLRTKPMPEASAVLDKWKSEGRKMLLDAGCGSGRHSFLASRMGFNVVGFDSSIEMVKLAKSKDSLSKYIVADLRFPPFKKDVFDCILYMASMHHLGKEDAGHSLSRMKDIMKSEAQMLISVWNKMQKRFLFSKSSIIVPWKKDGKSYPRFYYMYTPLEFRNMVSRVGFKKLNFFLDERKSIIASFSRNVFALVEK